MLENVALHAYRWMFIYKMCKYESESQKNFFALKCVVSLVLLDPPNKEWRHLERDVLEKKIAWSILSGDGSDGKALSNE